LINAIFQVDLQIKSGFLKEKLFRIAKTVLFCVSLTSNILLSLPRANKNRINFTLTKMMSEGIMRFRVSVIKEV